MLQIAGGIWLAILIPILLVFGLSCAFLGVSILFTALTGFLLWVGGILKSILCGEYPVAAIWLYSILACIAVQTLSSASFLISWIFLAAIIGTFSMWIFYFIKRWQEYLKPENKAARRAEEMQETARKRRNAQLWRNA